MAKFCSNCGAELNEEQEICLKCGVRVKNSNTKNTDPNAKSKIAAGLLGILLGAFGVHNFYLGNTGKAVGQLLITVLSCGILSPISGIWGLVEGIMILTGSINTDANAGLKSSPETILDRDSIPLPFNGFIGCGCDSSNIAFFSSISIGLTSFIPSRPIALRKSFMKMLYCSNSSSFA